MDQQILIALAALIGTVMGFLFATSGFADQGKSDDLSKNPRVKNLIWLIGAGGAVFLADWKIMSGGGVDPALRGQLVFAYVAAAVVLAVVTIAFISAIIYLSVRAAARHNPALRDYAGELVVQYVSFGLRAYRTLRAEFEIKAGESLSAAEALRTSGSTLSILFAAVALDRKQSDHRLRDQFIDQTLEAIEDTVKLFAPKGADLQLQTNYMVRVPQDGLNGLAPHFAPDPLDSYEAFLILRRYRQGGNPPVALPICKPQPPRSQLPGAPMAVVTQRACLLNTAKVTFKPGVPAKVQKDIRAFFRDVHYASVLSLPIIWDREVIGVVNIESDQVDLVGRGADMVARIGSALAPYSVVLGELVSRRDFADAQ